MVLGMGCLLLCVAEGDTITDSYNREHLIGSGLQLQRFCPLLSWQGDWWYPGRGDAGLQSYLHLPKAVQELL